MSDSSLTPFKPSRLLRWIQANDPEKLSSLCLMHLSFLLDLPDNELELLAGSDKNKDYECFKVEKGFLKGITRKFSKDTKQKTGLCFGIQLIPDVLKLIDPIFEFLNCEQNLTEGIFRKTGNLSRQRVLKTYLDEGIDVTDELNYNTYSSHDCANLLKSFLGELPEPLLAENNFAAYCQVADLSNDTKKLQCIQLLMRLIPKENLKLVKQLMSLLNKICKNEHTLMSYDTLATIFVPHLVVPKNLSAKDLFTKLPPLTRLISFMIQSKNVLFQIPDNLKRDIMELHRKSLNKSDQCDNRITAKPSSSSSSSSSSSFLKLKNTCKLNSFSPSNCLHKRKSSDKENHPGTGNSNDEITTMITFTDKQACMDASKDTYTHKALNELYDYINSLPDSTKKRRLMKQACHHNVEKNSSHPSPSSSSYPFSPRKYMNTRTTKNIEDVDNRGAACEHYDELTPYRKAFMKQASRAHIVDCNDMIMGEGASINLSPNESLSSSSSSSSLCPQ